MALTNRERIGKGLELLLEGLYDVVDEVMTQEYGTSDWNVRWAQESGRESYSKSDVYTHLRAITEQGACFKDVLSRAQQSYAEELRETRHAWAHGDAINSEDALRALQTMELLLKAVDASHSAAEVRELRMSLQATILTEAARSAVRKQVDLPTGTGLKPWREVISPHDDVASGNFNAAEFAADLYEVAQGTSRSVEYASPVEFFDRTYLTQGLYDLLARAIRRLGGDMSASPVVNLQTNFGGGKTHSMIALYHLFGGTDPALYPEELQDLIGSCGDADLRDVAVRRAVLVGTYVQPSAAKVQVDGTLTHTLWGDLAWQLGGAEGYALVAESDASGTNPGEALRRLVTAFSPCLILIDEWVAYARQLFGKDLPAGSFETQFTFAQSLTEVVSATPGAMLVVSIPASHDGADGAAGAAGSGIEVGGEHGQAALQRLQNVIRRVADQWRPSSKDESFEIVRRRLFQAIDMAGLADIKATAKVFTRMYRENPGLFTREACVADDSYARRIEASYPIHPELLDRLYEDWSTLDRFQRTRGVLRLVNHIVHALWSSDDNSPLIMPGSVPLDDSAVNSDLTQYLEDSWKPIIDADIDGPASTSAEIDGSRTSLGQRHVTRRLARTVFIGAAPKARTVHRGLDRQRVWLGSAMPGDPLGSYGVALELLLSNSTFFYADNDRYWFDTAASISKAARDRAEQLREDPEAVYAEVVRRLETGARERDVFDRVHVAPQSGADVIDAESCRLVVVHPRWSYKRGVGPEEGEAGQWVGRAVQQAGAGQRTHRNALVFLLADSASMDGLESAVREYLGWRHIDASADELNLTSQQLSQVAGRVAEADARVGAQVDSAYVWLCWPTQADPTRPFSLEFTRLSDSADGGLARRAAMRLMREEQLIREYAPGVLGWSLRSDLASVWQRGDVSVGELWGFHTRYLYMARLLDRGVLDASIEASLQALGFDDAVGERFALAAEKDPDSGRYIGLVFPPDASAQLQVTDQMLLVDWEVAERQQAAGGAAGVPGDEGGGCGDAAAPGGGAARGAAVPGGGAAAGEPARPAGHTHFHGAVTIDSDLYAKELSTISQEVIGRLAASGAELVIRMEIEAVKPGGFDADEMRTIKENARSLGFDEHSGFEEG
jgi:predicted AAA+ superfamily ATPase